MSFPLVKGLLSQKNSQELLIFLEEILNSKKFPIWCPNAPVVLQTWTEKIVQEGNILCGHSIAKLLCIYLTFIEPSNSQSVLPIYMQLNNLVDLTTGWDSSDQLLTISLWEGVYDLCMSLYNLNPDCFQDHLHDLSYVFLKTTVSRNTVLFLRHMRLKAFNKILENVEEDFRNDFMKLHPNCVEELIQALEEVGDYDVQTSLIEAVFRLTSSSERPKGVSKWFNNMKHKIQHLFLRIKDFDPDCRLFLNAYNIHLGQNRKVFTFSCLQARLGSFILRKPKVPSYERLWIDFNTGSSTLSMLFDRGEETPSQSERFWETIIIYDQEVESVVLTNGIYHSTLVLHLGKDPIEFFASPPSESMCHLLSSEFVIDLDVNTQELKSVCQLLFKDKLKMTESLPRMSVSSSFIEQEVNSIEKREVVGPNSHPRSDCQSHSEKEDTDSCRTTAEGQIFKATSLTIESISMNTGSKDFNEPADTGRKGSVETRSPAHRSHVPHENSSVTKNHIVVTDQSSHVQVPLEQITSSKDLSIDSSNSSTPMRRLLTNKNSSSGSTSLFPSFPSSSSLCSSSFKLKHILNSAQKMKMKKKPKKRAKRNDNFFPDDISASLEVEVGSEKEAQRPMPTVVLVTEENQDVDVDSNNEMNPPSPMNEEVTPLALKLHNTAYTSPINSRLVRTSHRENKKHLGQESSFHVSHSRISESEVMIDVSKEETDYVNKMQIQTLFECNMPNPTKNVNKGCNEVKQNTINCDIKVKSVEDISSLSLNVSKDDIKSKIFESETDCIVLEPDRDHELVEDNEFEGIARAKHIVATDEAIQDFGSKAQRNESTKANVLNKKEITPLKNDDTTEADSEMNKDYCITAKSKDDDLFMNSYSSFKNVTFDDCAKSKISEMIETPASENVDSSRKVVSEMENGTDTRTKTVVRKSAPEKGGNYLCETEYILIEKEECIPFETADEDICVHLVSEQNDQNISRKRMHKNGKKASTAVGKTGFVSHVSKPITSKAKFNTNNYPVKVKIVKKSVDIGDSNLECGSLDRTVTSEKSKTVFDELERPERPVTLEHSTINIGDATKSDKSSSNCKENSINLTAATTHENSVNDIAALNTVPEFSPRKSLSSTLEILAHYPIKPTGLKTPKRTVSDTSCTTDSKKKREKCLPEHYSVTVTPGCHYKKTFTSKKKLFDVNQDTILNRTPPEENEVLQIEEIMTRSIENEKFSDNKELGDSHSQSGFENQSDASQNESRFRFFKTRNQEMKTSLESLPPNYTRKKRKIKKRQSLISNKDEFKREQQEFVIKPPLTHSTSVFSDCEFSNYSDTPDWFPRKKKTSKSVTRTYPAKKKKISCIDDSSESEEYVPHKGKKKLKISPRPYSIEDSTSGGEGLCLFKSPKSPTRSLQFSKRIMTRSYSKKLRERKSKQAQFSSTNSSYKRNLPGKVQKEKLPDIKKKKKTFVSMVNRVFSSPEVLRNTSLTQPSSVDDVLEVEPSHILATMESKKRPSLATKHNVSEKGNSFNKFEKVGNQNEPLDKLANVEKMRETLMGILPLTLNKGQSRLNSNYQPEPPNNTPVPTSNSSPSYSELVSNSVRNEKPEEHRPDSSKEPSRVSYVAEINNYPDSSGVNPQNGQSELDSQYINDVLESPDFFESIGHKLRFESQDDNQAMYSPHREPIEIRNMIPSRPNSDFSSSEEDAIFSPRQKNPKNIVEPTSPHEPPLSSTLNSKSDLSTQKGKFMENQDHMSSLLVSPIMLETRQLTQEGKLTDHREPLSPLLPVSLNIQIQESEESEGVACPVSLLSEVQNNLSSYLRDSQFQDLPHIKQVVSNTMKDCSQLVTPKSSNAQNLLQTPKPMDPRCLFGEEEKSVLNSPERKNSDHLVYVPLSTLKLLMQENSAIGESLFETSRSLLETSRRCLLTSTIIKNIMNSKSTSK